MLPTLPFPPPLCFPRGSPRGSQLRQGPRPESRQVHGSPASPATDQVHKPGAHRTGHSAVGLAPLCQAPRSLGMLLGERSHFCWQCRYTGYRGACIDAGNALPSRSREGDPDAGRASRCPLDSRGAADPRRRPGRDRGAPLRIPSSRRRSASPRPAGSRARGTPPVPPGVAGLYLASRPAEAQRRGRRQDQPRTGEAPDHGAGSRAEPSRAGLCGAVP